MKIRIAILFVFLNFLMLNFLIKAEAKEWQTMKSRHFIVNYRIEVPEDFVNTVVESSEDSYKAVIGNLGISWYQSWAWEDPINLYIYKDQDDYVNNGGQAGWSHGASLIGSKTIRTFPSDEGFFDSLLPHELGHIILHEYLGKYVLVPLWFDEGVAMYQEKAKRIGANKIVKEAILNGQFIPLTQLTDMRLYMNSDRKTVELFYAESASILNFMINELGSSHFYKLCAELKENTPFETAITKIYMYINNLEMLNKKWVTYLKELS